jgi:acyl-CoA synthetase (AMP-forming)/AMP-acid ligase II
LIFEGRELTYRQFYDGVIRVGNWLINGLRVKEGEVVALNGGNSMEYLLCWFGIEAIGAVPSFINCNLTGKSLMHCIQVSICIGVLQWRRH